MYATSDSTTQGNKLNPHQYVSVPAQDVPTLSHGTKKSIWAHIRPWTEELIWCALALGFFGGLVAVLFHFDNHPLPDWPLGLTVNTLVALLATVCRAMVIVPIEEGLSQLKWNWFATGRRPLRNLHDFDQASRGPWGAICLVPKTRGRFISFSTIAAIVWATGIATSFVTQSTITFRSELIPVPAADASVPIGRSFPESLLESGMDDQDVFEGVTRGGYQSAFHTVNQSLPEVEPTCSGSQCDWEAISSLAYCTSLQNVTEYLEVSGPLDGQGGKTLYNASLPDGLGFLNFTDELHVMMNMSSPVYQQTIDGQDNPGVPIRTTLGDWASSDIKRATIAQFYIIYSNASPNFETRFRAVELLWHFCVQTYSVQVRDGVDETKTISSTTDVNTTKSMSDGQSNWDSFTLIDEERKHSFNVTTSPIHLRIDENFRDAFSGDWSSDSKEGVPSRLAYQVGYNIMSGTGPVTPDVEFDNKTWNNLQIYTNHIADGMTAFLRTADAKGSVSGEVASKETYIFVRWERLSLLAGQLALTVAFVIAITIQTAIIGVDVVKSSNAAELFALQEQSNGPRTLEKSKSWGIKTKVGKESEGILTNTGGGWKLKI